jgi:sugar lactone lactonase YvrE
MRTRGRNTLESLRRTRLMSELHCQNNIVRRIVLRCFSITMRAMRNTAKWMASITALAFWFGCNTEPLFTIKVSLPRGANGIAFDANNVLYIASLRGNEIVVADASTGTILKRFGIEQGVETPDDLAFGPDGSLYWTSFEIGKVCRLSPQGQRSDQMLAPGVNPIAFSDDGRLFVAVAYLGDALFQVDPLLRDPPRLIAKDLGWLNGMNWGRDGYLYAPVWSKGQVVRIDVNSGETVVVANGFGRPSAVKFDSRGCLHLVDYQTGKVWQINIKTGRKQELIQLSPHLDNLAFDSRDRLFVSHAEEGNVYEILPKRHTKAVGQDFPCNK